MSTQETEQVGALMTSRRLDLQFFRQSVIENGILKGNFILSNGERTDTYFDMRRILQSPREARDLSSYLYRLANDYDVEAIGGPATGGPLISQLVVSNPNNWKINGFFTRETTKDHGVESAVSSAYLNAEGGTVLGLKTRVMVVDDVLTSGKSLASTIDLVRSRGCDVVCCFVLVDRGDQRADWLRHNNDIDFLPFYVVGGDGCIL